MTAAQALILIVLGFGLRSLVDVIAWLIRSRPRRFHLPRDYFDPCGPECKAKRMTQIGERYVSLATVTRNAKRLSKALRAGTV